MCVCVCEDRTRRALRDTGKGFPEGRRNAGNPGAGGGEPSAYPVAGGREPSADFGITRSHLVIPIAPCIPVPSKLDTGGSEALCSKTEPKAG